VELVFLTQFLELQLSMQAVVVDLFTLQQDTVQVAQAVTAEAVQAVLIPLEATVRLIAAVVEVREADLQIWSAVQVVQELLLLDTQQHKEI
jgi:hypothetical protein